MFNRHYTVLNDDIRNTKLKDRFDFVCCISTLEHIGEWESAARCMRSLLNPGGHLLLTFPFSEERYVDNVYALPEAGYGQSSPYICQVYSRREVQRMLPESEGGIVDQQYWRFWDGELWTFGNQEIPPKRVEKSDLHQLTCILFRKNAD
jgi:SAM-dependent methyltransferase